MATSLTHRVVRARFSGLTAVLITLSGLASLIQGEELRRICIDIAFTALLLFAVVSTDRKLRLLTVVLALPCLLGHWSLRFGDTPLHRIAVFAFSALFLAYLTVIVIIAVLRDESITSDTIVGALCAYFLIGFTFGAVYALVALVSPDAFEVSPALTKAAGWGPPGTPVAPLLQYYSFTTLSTVGFGDISPLTAGARALSAMEAMTGQLYITVLISRLVSMHSARSRGK